MRTLTKKLGEWANEGIITQEQVRAIANYEERSSGTKNWVLWGITAIGVVAVGTGLVSIIAANWAALTDAIKLVAYFALQAGLGFAFYRFRERDGLVREALLLSSIIAVLAGIGLVAQIYNLQGDGWRALSFWLVLVLPLTLLAERRLAHDVWFLGLLVTVVLWIVAGITKTQDLNRTLVAFSIGYLVLALGLATQLRLPSLFTAAGRRWSLAVLVGFLPIFGNLLWANGGLSRTQLVYSPSAMGAVWVAVALALLSLRYNAEFPQRTVAALAVTIVLVAGTLTVPLMISVGDQEFLGCLLFLAIWSSAASAAAFSGRYRLYNLATLVIAVRFIVVYFELFGSLAQTGVGLIFSGLIILGIAYLWHRLRHNVLKRLEETV